MCIRDRSWFYLNLKEDNFVSGLAAGYYLWVASFFISGVGWMQRAQAAA